MAKQTVPLTPAEHMRHIRETVNATQLKDEKDAEALLAHYLSRLDVIRSHLMEMESTRVLSEYQFTSQVPLIGRLIVWIRNLWNWMSTRWYVLPLIQRQNQFNAKTTHTLQEMLLTLETLSLAVQKTQVQLGQLESNQSDADSD